MVKRTRARAVAATTTTTTAATATTMRMVRSSGRRLLVLVGIVLLVGMNLSRHSNHKDGKLWSFVSTKMGGLENIMNMDQTLPSTSAATTTAAFSCRKALEPWQNANIHDWMEYKAPWVEWIWELQDTNGADFPQEQAAILQNRHLNSNTTTTTVRPRVYYLVLLLTIDTGLGNHRPNVLADLPWTWQDVEGNTFAATPVLRNRMVEPKNGRVYLRLDPPLPPPSTNESSTSESLRMPQPKYLWQGSINRTATMMEPSSSIMYDLEPYLKCSRLDQQFPPQASSSLTTTTSSPPNRNNTVKIGACLTRFWGQLDLLPEWIAYHRLVGIQHFWLFVTDTNDTALWQFMAAQHATNRQEDITLIPYNYTWAGHRHKRPASYQMKFGGESLFQPAAANQCLYLAKLYALDWVIVPDIDEYIAVLKYPPFLNHSQDNHNNNTSTSPLQKYLQPYESDPNVGQICMKGVAFGRHTTKEKPLGVENGDGVTIATSTSVPTNFQVTIDFTHRLNKTLGVTGDRQKCWYRPRMVQDAWIHLARKHFGQKIMAVADDMDLYHYRTPILGVYDDTHLYTNKNATDVWVSYPELRDWYRASVVQALQDSQLAFPNFTAHMDLGYGNAY